MQQVHLGLKSDIMRGHFEPIIFAVSLESDLHQAIMDTCKTKCNWTPQEYICISFNTQATETEP